MHDEHGGKYEVKWADNHQVISAMMDNLCILNKNPHDVLSKEDHARHDGQWDAPGHHQSGT